MRPGGRLGVCSFSTRMHPLSSHTPMYTHAPARQDLLTRQRQAAIAVHQSGGPSCVCTVPALQSTVDSGRWAVSTRGLVFADTYIYMCLDMYRTH